MIHTPRRLAPVGAFSTAYAGGDARSDLPDTGDT
jgi:hypothetical protein